MNPSKWWCWTWEVHPYTGLSKSIIWESASWENTNHPISQITLYHLGVQENYKFPLDSGEDFRMEDARVNILDSDYWIGKNWFHWKWWQNLSVFRQTILFIAQF